MRYFIFCNSTIWINSLVISQYINRMLRLELKNWQSNNKGVYGRNSLGVNEALKKYFRPTNDYCLALTAIGNQVNDILKISTLCLDDFNAIDIKKMILWG